MDLDAAERLEPGQVIWFQPKGDPLETAGPSIVLRQPEVQYEALQADLHMPSWVEVEILTPTTILIARDEELFYSRPVWA